MSVKNRLTKSYDPEFRAHAAKLVMVEDMSISEVAKDLGMPSNTLDGGVRKFRTGIWSLDTAASDIKEAPIRPGFVDVGACRF